jgi:hypothetical protein
MLKATTWWRTRSTPAAPAVLVITQQPLGGKAQFGDQRFGEIVWALEALRRGEHPQERSP